MFIRTYWNLSLFLSKKKSNFLLYPLQHIAF